VGTFVGSDEIGAYVRDALGDRFQKREAHLQWAAEVTQTIALDELAQRGLEVGEVSILTDDINRMSEQTQEVEVEPLDEPMILRPSRSEIKAVAALAPPLSSRVPPPPPPPLPSFELSTSTDVQAVDALGGRHHYDDDEDDDDAITTVVGADLGTPPPISMVHSPAKSVQPAPVPDQNVVVAAFDSAPEHFAPRRAPPLPSLPAAHPPLPALPSRGRQSHILIAITAAATTLIALSLSALVITQLMSNQHETASAPPAVSPGPPIAPPPRPALDEPIDPSTLPTEPLPGAAEPMVERRALKERARATLQPRARASTAGYLTLVCDPFCDSVIAAGKNLGPSPVVRALLPAGDHSVTLRRKDHPSKTIVMTIVSGQTTARRVKMDP